MRPERATGARSGRQGEGEPEVIVVAMSILQFAGAQTVRDEIPRLKKAQQEHQNPLVQVPNHLSFVQTGSEEKREVVEEAILRKKLKGHQYIVTVDFPGRRSETQIGTAQTQLLDRDSRQSNHHERQNRGGREGGMRETCTHPHMLRSVKLLACILTDGSLSSTRSDWAHNH
ncbi:hypothetical protein EYF80_017334 [Liparis tanakae]|uniref:Uncharacterized protein n=1 Tax=Liparis tanakae TaxID=230148 RepID=A0A4Z2I397_9TELE|nr:hypothetical protein EYF80_017334 [Liparis tanakae]